MRRSSVTVHALSAVCVPAPLDDIAGSLDFVWRIQHGVLEFAPREEAETDFRHVVRRTWRKLDGHKDRITLTAKELDQRGTGPPLDFLRGKAHHALALWNSQHAPAKLRAQMVTTWTEAVKPRAKGHPLHGLRRAVGKLFSRTAR